MSDNKRKKMASKKAKAAAKKEKFSSKMGKKSKFFGALAALIALVGCSTSEPASRMTKAEYGDITINGNNNRVTLGDGAYASADSDGSTETMTANPTNTTDVKPDVDVNTTGGRTAGILESLMASFGTWLKTDDGKAACSSCCEPGACSE